MSPDAYVPNISLFTMVPVIMVLLLIEGFFAGSEIALLSSDPLHLRKLQKKGSKGAKVALRLIKNPSMILSTTLLVTAACVVAISSLIELYFQSQESHSPYTPVLIASTLVVILGELTPKSLFRRYAKTLAPMISRPILFTFYVFYPVTALISRLTSQISNVLGPLDVLVTGKLRTTRDELVNLLNASRKEMDIRSSEQKMIKRILDFKDSEAKNALIPLFDVDAVDRFSTVSQILADFDRHRHSRLPVYEERVDNITGILEVWDLFGVSNLSMPISRFVKPATYFSETQTLESVFKILSHTEAEMGIVVDEHGGATGILTFEDIVEEVVGDIRDEDDPEMPLIREIKPGKWMVQARVNVQDFNEELKVDLPEGEYETIAGFLLQQFGQIPRVGDHLEFQTEIGTIRFSIRQASPRRIDLVTVEKI